MISEFSLADTDLCVMCAMCTPHCPTYRVYKTETESPRGRIALMQALDKGDIKPAGHVLDHLNHCLGCLACEQLCPSQVPFGKLMDASRQRFSATKQSVILKLLLRLTQHQQGLDYYQQWIGFLKRSKLIKLWPNSSSSRSIIQQADSTQFKDFYPATQAKKGSLGLFKGCMGKSFDAETLMSSITLLTHLGFDVYMPDKQYCCGALHQHNGHINDARILAEKNRQRFQQYKLDHILYTASGCGSQITSSQFSAPVQDIVSFLRQSLPHSALKFKPLNRSVVIHNGCRGRNDKKLQPPMSQSLLDHIPNINIISVADENLCCGAGGGTQIDYPELASKLLSIKLKALKNIQADYLLSDNIGCSLHFKSGINKHKLNIEVIHPVTLLARQML